MLISMNWLKRYVPVPDSVETFVHDLTMAGLNVETWRERGLRDPNIVVGRVLEVAKHPDADRLSVCRVAVSEAETKRIVCGAPNVAAGQFVPVALIGAALPNGLTIKKTRIRGVDSEGMICSDIELGMGQDAKGIMVLDGEYVLGTPIADILMPPDVVLELEVTPNRPDLLSHAGVARETAAIYQKTFAVPEATVESAASDKPEVRLEIESGSDCPRYVGRIVRGVKVGPSPAWLANSLEAVGINSINNIVDITNFVMMELGQPLHSFDLKKLRGGAVIVRRAFDGEILAALDGETYELTKEHLVIADEKGPVALAGIIGGNDTAVTAGTADLFLECACFHPTLVRRTRKALGISTEASYRFERGSDREICRKASDRAVALFQEIAGGTPGEVLDVYKGELEPRVLDFETIEVRRLLGINLGAADVARLLAPLGFACTSKDSDLVRISVPSYRADVAEEADIVEEIARMYGYDRIGKGWDYRCTVSAGVEHFDEFMEAVLDHLASRGFTETITSSFNEGSEADAFGWPADDPRRERIAIRNPLVSTQRFMRTSLLPGMLDVVRRNLDQGLKRLYICQAGKVFLGRPDGRGLPEERWILTLIMTKPQGDDFWLNMNKDVDLFDIKREVELMGRRFKIDIWHDFHYAFQKKTGMFTYAVRDRTMIEGGILNDAVSAKYDFDQPVFYAEMDLAGLFKACLISPRAKPLPEYPVSKRDLSLVVKSGITWQEIEKSLVKNCGGLLESLKLFDVYTGDQIPSGTTAYGIKIQFRANDRTLTDAEIDSVIDKVLSKLKNELDVELRS
ncbi:MAG: phenylalanine--tRNA ligase subunit beta [Chitinivibrionia bacterium]|nr:phenylalanine--tRNA ligase subunit beta [Chitinivibrionia bacterium]